MYKNILIVSDAAFPQVNGVVTTLLNLKKELEKMGHTVFIFSHELCVKKYTLPFYPEISLGFPTKDAINDFVNRWADVVHIATPEGTIGRAFVKFCDRHRIPYTTGYHTNWPEFVKAKFSWVPRGLVYRIMRGLHKNSRAVMVPTETVYSELKLKHFKNLKVWTRGVDRTIFNKEHRCKLHCGRPLLLCVSRISKEKNLEDFCNLEWPVRHTKMLVGGGPHFDELKEKYGSTVIFTGELHGDELAHAYACADVFVFPSRSDTFGVVMIEAMATGTPVAAYPVTGPIDVVEPGATGYLDHNLKTAVELCLKLDRDQVEVHSMKWSWETCAQQFLNYSVSKS